MVAQRSPPRGGCPRRRSRRSANRRLPKSSRITPKFCPLPAAAGWYILQPTHSQTSTQTDERMALPAGALATVRCQRRSKI
ncbi:MAG TPA: hypothetical protein DF966_16845, partial [Sulfitobacter sp.]|nr:hypothetical protein [Sulfitobacter sp.]